MAVRTSLGADPTGLALRSHVNERVKSLFDAVRLPLTDVGGTGDAVTATLDPDFDGDGILDGMTFGITWGAANTGAVTLAINGGSAIAVLDAEGNALAGGELASGLRSSLEYVSGDLRLQSPASGGAAFGRSYDVFTASGAWTPPDLPDDTPVFVECWGAGAGGHTHGSTGGGGGGGGYAFAILRLGDLGSSVTCTVAASPAAGANGGDTSFGSFLTAYGGRAGATNRGGGGAGSNNGGSAGTGGYLGGGQAGLDNSPDPSSPASGATSESGGGGGGWDGDGGPAVNGGGGGGGGTGSSGGSSKHGGDGGAPDAAGAAPGGGGGRNAAGGRGEIRIWI